MFNYYNPNPANRKVGDCAVRAIAKALNTTWEQAYIILSTKGYEMCDMPSANSVWGAVLKDNGFIRAAVPNYCPECYTIKDFCLENPIGIYILGTGSHVVAVENGEYYDAWDSGNEIPQIIYKR